jgi:hypothetical protein
MVIVQMDAQPNNEPHIPYSSHIKGPAHKNINPVDYDNSIHKTTENKPDNYAVIINKLFLSKEDRFLFSFLIISLCT